MFYRLITFIRRWLIIRREKLIQHEMLEKHGKFAVLCDPDMRPKQVHPWSGWGDRGGW